MIDQTLEFPFEIYFCTANSSECGAFIRASPSISITPSEDCQAVNYMVLRIDCSEHTVIVERHITTRFSVLMLET